MTGEGVVPGAQAVYRALAVLDAFSQSRPAMTIAEIAEATALTAPTAHRIALALVDRGFLTRDEVSRRFSVGPAVLRLAQLTDIGHSAFAYVGPLLETLRVETGETVGLHVRVGSQRVCVLELESPHRVRVVSGIGHTYPLTAAAASKAILAWLRPDQIESVLREPAPGLDQAKLRADLRQARHDGYAISFGETIPGAHAVAAPLRDSSGEATAAVNVTGPADRLPESRLRDIGRDLSQKLQLIHQSRRVPQQMNNPEDFAPCMP
ncbi:IclR family transcriptional regulator [Micromonospora sp. AP08]|uniref:IclR family transcriptional regulator n=1 Tax=Micromonospora sp. AP08 TaxID=2604467 RepID=UPI0011D4EBE6|nr:IclR family transcriptional regulator [Micromonospora sp. AP08]TYB39708.1 IclR family transcriptional regulator [Micromonospora sp. AP08]